MEQQLSFLEPSPPTDDEAPVWSTLDDEQRAEVVKTLARLIAKATIGARAEPQEKSDD